MLLSRSNDAVIQGLLFSEHTARRIITTYISACAVVISLSTSVVLFVPIANKHEQTYRVPGLKESKQIEVGKQKNLL